MRQFTSIIVIIAAISSIAAPSASAVSTNGSGGSRGGKATFNDLSVQQGSEPTMIYKLKDVIVSS